MSPLDEVAPGVWRFTVTRNGIPPTMTAYALSREVDGELRAWPRHREIDRRRTWYKQRFLPTLAALTGSASNGCS